MELIMILAAAALAVAAWLWMLSGNKDRRGSAKPPEDEGEER